MTGPAGATVSAPVRLPLAAVSGLTGTRTLIRLALRRDRIPLAAWVLGIGGTVASTFAAFRSLYPAEADRVALLSTVDANPALVALYGEAPGSSIGGLTAWRYGVVGAVLVGLMAIFTVIRRTRADEEAGRTELLAAGVVGRAASLAAAVWVAGGACVAIGVAVTAGGLAAGEDPIGSLALGGALTGCGLVFAAVAAVAAQLFESARSAIAWSGGALALAFALRAVGDSGGAGWLVWLSPLGWVERVSAFGTNRLWVLMLFVATAGAGLLLAGRLLERRDVGLALLATRLGAASDPRLSTPEALALRLHRGPAIGWVVAFGAFGVVVGAIASSAGDLAAGSPQLEQVLAQFGGRGAIVNAFFAALGAVAGILAGAASIATALRMSGEESAERVGPVLATAVGRARWIAGHTVAAALVPAVGLLVCGAVAGLLHGAQTGDVGAALGIAVPATIVQIPAALVVGGLAVLLFGLAPRFAAASWAALTGALLLGQLGRVLQLPQAVVDLSPFTHVPGVPAEHVRWLPLVLLLVVAAAFTAAGVVGFRRRDVL